MRALHSVEAVIVATQWPVIVHDQVSAGADGSTLILEVDSVDSEVHRVYFLHKTSTRKIKVRHHGSTKKRDLVQAGTYVDVSATGEIGQPQLIATAPPKIQQFLAHVKAMAVLADLPAS